MAISVPVLQPIYDHTFDPAQAAKITVPVLVLTGADTPDEIKDDPETVAAALPDARPPPGRSPDAPLRDDRWHGGCEERPR